jgi:hypothetical protein
LLDLNALLVLCGLQIVVSLLRWLYQRLDTNKGDPTYYNAAGIQDTIDRLKEQGQLGAALWYEITELSKILGPVALTKLWELYCKNSDQLAAICCGGGMGSAGLVATLYGFLYIVGVKHFAFVWLDATVRARPWFNPVLNETVIIASFLVGAVVAMWYAVPYLCTRPECHFCHSKSRQELRAWGLVGYSAFLIAAVVNDCIERHLLPGQASITTLVMACVQAAIAARMLDRTTSVDRHVEA